LLGAGLFFILSWKLWTARYTAWISPEELPWFGCTLSFPYNGHAFFKLCKEWANKYGYLACAWFGPIPVLIIARSEYVEAILSSKTLIRKSSLYDFLHEWLGTGLLTSTGSKWKSRRRAITPSFHFSILNGFAEIFDEQGRVLVDRLGHAVDSGEESIDVQVPVSLAKLDVICETSMGVNINAQSSPTSSYVTAINCLNNSIQVRQKSPWLWPKFLYTMTSAGKEFYRSLDIVKGFTTDVINKSIVRRKAQKERGTVDDVVDVVDVDENNKRRRPKVFLDMLLDLYDAGEIDVEGIQEEVDTFMFEGHDTTATAMAWTLYELGRRPDIQDKLHLEIVNADQNMGIIERVKSLKYLDHVLKEGMRLHPPVPIFARQVEEDTPVDDKIIPKGTQLAIFTYMLHRNPEYWDDPNTFNPDRFGKDDYLKRNPYIYIPFSAGSRNCIGQKFALLEEKIMMYHVVANYRFVSLQNEDDIEDCMEIIHKSENGLYLKFVRR